MKRITVIVLSVVMICFSVLSVSAVDYKCDAETVSDAVYLENLSAGAVVYEKNADQKSYPASTTKIMTFIVTAENVSDLEHTNVTVRQDLIGGLDPESTVMGLSAHIGAQVSGKILYFGKGLDGEELDYCSTVTNGMLLAKIDDVTYVADLNVARAQLKRAEASVAVAKASLKVSSSQLSI